MLFFCFSDCLQRQPTAGNRLHICKLTQWSPGASGSSEWENAWPSAHTQLTHSCLFSPCAATTTSRPENHRTLISGAEMNLPSLWDYDIHDCFDMLFICVALRAVTLTLGQQWIMQFTCCWRAKSRLLESRDRGPVLLRLFLAFVEHEQDCVLPLSYGGK